MYYHLYVYRTEATKQNINKANRKKIVDEKNGKKENVQQAKNE